MNRKMDSTENQTSLKLASDNAKKTRFTYEQGPRKVTAADGKFVNLQSLGVRFLVWNDESAGLFSMIEHPIPAKTLVSPLHKHTNEDEYSFILEGRMGAMLGDDVVYAEAGELVFKPRNQWHTFWNDGETDCRVLEIIAPGGFEQYFDEARDLMTAMNAHSIDEISGPGMPGAELAAKYGLEYKPESVEMICKRYNLVYPGSKPFGSRIGQRVDS